LAANFSALVGMRRRRLVMRCTIGTTVVMTGLVVAVLAFRPPVIDDPAVVKAQAGPAAPSATATTAAPDTKSPATRRNDELSAATRRKLDELIDIDFSDTPLRDAIRFIGAKLDVQFYLDPNSLGDLSINSDTPVTLQLKQVPAEMALDLIMQRLQTGYTVRSGIVTVYSQTALDNQLETRVYHIPRDSAEELVELVPGSLAPTSWDAVGGPGSIRVFRDSLVVSQTPEVHRKIEKLLKDLEPVLAKGPPPKPETAGDAAAGEGSGYGATGYGTVAPRRRGVGAPGHGGTGYGGAR
jgi:hypothetical protein